MLTCARNTSFYRIAGAEYQGLRTAKLWTPESNQEYIDAYRRVWQLVVSRLDALEGDEQKRAINILLDSMRGLIPSPELELVILGDVAALATKPYFPKKVVLEHVEAVLYYDKKSLSPEAVKEWEQLRDSLTGDDFPSLMQRYVGMDLLEDRFDDDRERVDKAEPYIQDLARQAVANTGLLEKELHWLVTQEAQNGYRFGYELGRADIGFMLLPTLLEAQRHAVSDPQASDFFLGGYLRVLFEVDPDNWEAIQDLIANDPQLVQWTVSLTWRSGISDRAALRIINLVKAGDIDVNAAPHLWLGKRRCKYLRRCFRGVDRVSSRRS